MPAEMIEASVSKPELSVLLWHDAVINAINCEPLKVPETIMKKYQDDPTYGERFRAWLLDAETNRHLNADSEPSEGEPPCKLQKINDSAGSTALPSGGLKYVDVRDVKGDLMNECNYASLKDKNVALAIGLASPWPGTMFAC